MGENLPENKYTHLTAIEREKLSFPARYLLKNKLLQGDILDFGCGYGKDVEILRSRSGTARSQSGAARSQSGTARSQSGAARSQSGAARSQNTKIERYDPHYFPKYPQGKFDTICCFYVLNVLFSESQESVIMAISQLLKPTGKAYFAVRRDLKTEGFRKHYIHKKLTYQCLVNLPFKSIHLDDFCEIYEYKHYNRQKNNTNRCIFCNPYQKLTLLTESSLAYSILDGYPLSKGHSLIIPKIHEENYFNLPFSVQSHCWQMVNEVQKIITEKYHPDGFNIGFNIHQAGGQKVKHTHIHLIPRYQGDNQGKKHGIRCVIP